MPDGDRKHSARCAVSLGKLTLLEGGAVPTPVEPCCTPYFVVDDVCCLCLVK